MSREQVVELIPALRAFARILCPQPENADDLVQETLIKAIANLNQYTEGTRLKSWLFTIMRNTFNTRYRKREREVIGLPPDSTNTLVTQPDQEWSARAKEVYTALMRLPDRYREILVLIVIQGESYEDAAVICDCAVGTVKSRLNRARQRLREEMGEAVED
ncbi:RNA polymerase sigma-70 factor (ECF subfamily) [Rhizobium aquaticum]|uniref:RNA polymerase sigma factor n=1 Tax=Rhizobium aquaticum TaxID=1549636 RepID=A0ABV2J2N8_9HYPH